MKFRNCAMAIAVFGAALTLVSPVNAASEEATHEARIRELEETVAELKVLLEQQSGELAETSVRVEEADEAVLHPADHPSTFEETQIKVGGFIKMDAFVSDYSKAPTVGNGDDFFIPRSLHTSGESRDPRLNLHSKETRFWLKSSTPSERGDIRTYFEIDFLHGQQGDERVGSSFSPRLRHAEISWGHWTVGQTWTNFFNTSSLPEYVDFLGPVGVVFARQAQVRYMLPTEHGSWVFTLENPETTLTPFGGGIRIDADDSVIPDLIVRRNWTADWGNISVAAMLRQLKIDRVGLDDSEIGGAIGLAGKFKVGDRDDVRWQANYGNALGRYMGLNSYNVGALDANGQIHLTTEYGVLAAYRHVWNFKLHSSLGGSFSQADNDTDISGIAEPGAYQSAHVNLIWSPVQRMSFGAEYIWGRREDDSGDDGILNRFQLGAKYIY